MKTKYIILFSFLGMLNFYGCQDLIEEPKSTLTPATYFYTQEELDASVAAIYQQFIDYKGVGGTALITCAFGADDLSTHPASNKVNFREFDQLNANVTNNVVNQNWVYFWKGIYQANNVIANYEQVNSPDDLKNGAAAQAYFLRAWTYYRAVREWGPMPLVLEGLDVDARPDRAPVSDIYDAIVNDLQTAIALFPSTFPTESNRANPLAAKALLSDVYLTMTGWPLNQTDKYSLAADYAKQVIQAGAYSLVPDYATVFTTNNNSEAIFSFQFLVSAGFPNRGIGQFSIPEVEKSLSGASGWNDFCCEVNFYKNAPKCIRSEQTFYDTLKIMNPDKKTFHLVPYNSPEAGATQRPFYKKWRYGLGEPGNGDGCSETDTSIINMNPSTGKNVDVIRYPMVLLDYAEASAMANGGPTAESYSAINIVRQRAGLADLTPGLSAEAFRDSVVHERAYEFAGEYGVRWFDIVRLQLLPKIVSERAPAPIENAIASGIDINTRYLSPIPHNEMVRNTHWEQNPGY